MLYKTWITNNTPEYEGFLAGLRMALGVGVTNLIARGDSQLVVRQVEKVYECPTMAPYVEEVMKLKKRFRNLRLSIFPVN